MSTITFFGEQGKAHIKTEILMITSKNIKIFLHPREFLSINCLVGKTCKDSTFFPHNKFMQDILIRYGGGFLAATKVYVLLSNLFMEQLCLLQ